MAIEHVTGSTDGVTTGISRTGGGDKDSAIVTVEGPVSVLEGITDFAALAPSGMTVESHTIEPNGDGFGKLVIRCVNYGAADVTTIPTRTTWRITMAEVQTPLIQHPHFDDLEVRSQIKMWLATDEAQRAWDGQSFKYMDAGGNLTEIDDEDVEDFCTAWTKGIESYTRHFPVIEKVSFYQRLPGVSMSGNSTTSGTVSQFAEDIDTWDVPALTLSGYASTGWFKSGDNYDQDQNRIWTRTEQWTWTPDGSDSPTGWIYDT